MRTYTVRIYIYIYTAIAIADLDRSLIWPGLARALAIYIALYIVSLAIASLSCMRMRALDHDQYIIISYIYIKFNLN